MANDKVPDVPSGQEPTIHGSTTGAAAPHVASEKANNTDDEPAFLENSPTNNSEAFKEAQRVNAIEALGIPDWQAKEKKIVRTLDMTLLPQLWILYMFNYLNRTNIAQARLDEDFEATLQLGNTDYSTAVALLTVGYMLAQLPSNMLITRVRPGLYLPTCAILWSGVSAATAAVTSPGQLFAVQFVLGIIEAPLFPGPSSHILSRPERALRPSEKAVYLMSCWYTRRELALRTALLYSGLVLAQAFSGLIAAGVFSGMSGAAGVAGWQWLFILEAALSAFFALTAYFILPNYPHSKTGGAMWSMTEDMRRIAVARIEADRVEQPTDSSVWQGLRLALTDMKTYIFAPLLLGPLAYVSQRQIFMNIFMTSSYGFNNFFPTMVRGFGMGSSTMALVLTAPPYILGTAVSFGVAWSSDRKKERGFHIMANNCMSIVGFIISVATLNTAARYTAAFLYTSGSFSANALVYTWAVSSLSQTPEKRAAGGAIVNIMGHLGNVMSPYFFPDSDSPRYTMAMILQIVFAGLTFCMAFTSKTYLRRQNKKLRATADEAGAVYNPFTT
ncbi:LOW QUALITY PROTEIN: major facilitator superfamily transporter [Colletotrichum tofieldiae]|nr:LOW QUALITY PROTEIN: major facilitator superfamily transporter [Colletotrichum tofieldiae]GKT69570.1 LOW QUALITY PROTEIN: major facilitator superfamily transporter [Colletotrichum tofieldiae]